MNSSRFLHFFVRAVVIASTTVAMIGCSSHSLNHYESLANQGILPLSSQSAYLGSNLFLSDEFSKSSDLFYFLKGRGAPNAISINNKNFSEVSMKLYYPTAKDYYVANRVVAENHYQWVTRGPYRIDRKDFRDLAGLFSDGVQEPVFEFRGKPFRFRGAEDELSNNRPLPLPTPVPTHPVSKSKSTSKTGKITTKLAAEGNTKTTAALAPTPFKPLTFDQQAIAMAQGFAERAPNGDVVHTVKTASESPETISSWYTGSPANYKEILKTSGIAEGTPLTVGARLEIPKGLVKQFKAMH